MSEFENPSNNSLVHHPSAPVALGSPGGALVSDMDPEDLRRAITRQKQLREIMVEYVKSELKEDHHYYYMSKMGKTNPLPGAAGALPGEKPALSQEGAYAIAGLFRAIPGETLTERERSPEGHLIVWAKARMFNIQGLILADGDGMCSTSESKYAFRKAERTCPECGQAAIIKGKKFKATDPEPGWLCWTNKNGCGVKFDKEDTRITGQTLGRIENPDRADQENTVLKMAIKRAAVAAVRKLPLVSELFVVDTGNEPPPSEKPQGQQRAQSQRPANNAPSGDKPNGDKPKTNGPVSTVVGFKDTLVQDHGVELKDLEQQFLPEGVKSFEQMTDAQAKEIVADMAALVRAKSGQGDD